MKDILYPLKDNFLEYSETLDFVAKLTELKYSTVSNAYCASFDELGEIAELLIQEDNLGKHTGYDLLYQQLYERKKDNFGRNVISRDENNDIICHAATYVELPELAVVSGVMTSFQYGDKGFSKGTLAALCDQLLSEDKIVFSYFHISPAIKMHEGVGLIRLENG